MSEKPQNTPDIRPLVDIMARLRAEGGCPWDREQTHDSLKPYLIEEAYEVLEALDRTDRQALREELGDLLLQIVFHARLAEEDGVFTMEDVIQAICNKMIRRHPHVFGDEVARDAAAVRDRWEQIKAAEGRPLFAGLPRGLPALMRAQRAGEKAAGVGFDWTSADQVMEKIEEELGELKEARTQGPARVFDELGDLLFTMANLARHLGVVAEDAVRLATDKFERRFVETQRLAAEQNRPLEQQSPDELEVLWQHAKRVVG